MLAMMDPWMIYWSCVESATVNCKENPLLGSEYKWQWLQLFFILYK